jgi:NAD-dependent dihydropyrimidine dehydrogenase PreA subunit
MQYELFDDQCFVEWFEKVKIRKNSVIIIGKEKQLHALWWKRNLPDNENFLFLEHPNFRTLTSMHLLFLLSMGAGKVILLEEPDFIASHPVAKEIQFANTIFSSLFGVDESVAVATRQNLSGILAETSTSPLSLSYSNFSFTNRREKLGAILKYLINQTDAASDEITTLTGRAFDAYGSVICDVKKCTHCGACLNDCKINALTSNEEELSLNHLGINCTQCSVCVQVCPEEALELQQGLQLAPAFFAPRELTRAEPVVCPECNKAFGTKKSFDRVMAKLKEHNSFSPENNFFEYCEKCRVVKLFESHQ